MTACWSLAAYIRSTMPLRRQSKDSSPSAMVSARRLAEGVRAPAVSAMGTRDARCTALGGVRVADIWLNRRTDDMRVELCLHSKQLPEKSGQDRNQTKRRNQTKQSICNAGRTISLSTKIDSTVEGGSLVSQYNHYILRFQKEIKMAFRLVLQDAFLLSSLLLALLLFDSSLHYSTELHHFLLLSVR